MSKCSFTLEELQTYIYYCPKTGNFYWKVTMGNRIEGMLAGCRDKKYIKIMIKGEQFLAHRLAWFYMTGKWPNQVVDHINGNGHDNKWKNLRACTHAENIHYAWANRHTTNYQKAIPNKSTGVTSVSRCRGLTQTQLKKVLHYAPHTGIFTWQNRGDRFDGKSAGTLNQGRVQIRVSVKGTSYIFQASCLAWLYMTGVWPKGVIDHVSGCSWDNRWSNLRECFHDENTRNRKKNRNNTSGLKGVTFYKPRGYFRANIGHNNKQIFLGAFKTAEEAYHAYYEAGQRLHGEFFRGV